MIISQTPFRISFFGGGTDYPDWYKKNGGAVLSMAIDKYCYISCRRLPPFFNHKTRIVWSKIETVKDVDDIEHPAVREAIKYLNINDGLEIHHDADLPARAGLGTSSSFSVGLFNALYALQGKVRTKKELAIETIHFEQNIIEENVGSQDQVAAAYGGFNRIDFNDSRVPSVTPVNIGSKKLDVLQKHIILLFTGLSRTASEVAEEQIKNIKNKEEELRAMHEMVSRAVSTLNQPSENLDEFGKLLHESWKIKRDLSSKITNPTINDIYTRARKSGALGGKILGAGGGGFMLIFADPQAHLKIKEELGELLHVPFKLENEGSKIIYNQSDQLHVA